MNSFYHHYQDEINNDNTKKNKFIKRCKCGDIFIGRLLQIPLNPNIYAITIKIITITMTLIAILIIGKVIQEYMNYNGSSSSIFNILLKIITVLAASFALREHILKHFYPKF